MKFDKETTIAFIVCIALIIAWGIYFKQAEEERVKKQSLTKNQNKIEKKEALTEQEARQIQQKEEPKMLSNSSNDKPSETQIQFEEKNAELKNDFISVTVSSLRASISVVEFFKYKNFSKTDNLRFGTNKLPYDALRVYFGENEKKTHAELESSEKKVTLNQNIAINGSILKLAQTFEISESNPYAIISELSITNTSDKTLYLDNFKISAGTIGNFRNMAGDPIQNEYFSIDTAMLNGAVKAKPYKGKEFSESQDNPAKWIALSNKYFCSILLPSDPFQEGNIMVANFAEKNSPLISSSGILKLKLAPGETNSFKLSLYVGPKEKSLLQNFHPDAAKIMHLGWNWLEPISQALLSLLIILSKNFYGYGWSIIILTIMVKLLFWPITEKANSSMKKMQKIQPMIMEIREKYKKDPQKMNQKIMELYKEHGVNPLGGCFPILLQIPVFFALYNTLNGAIELRQASFLWASDLSRPDTILTIPGIGLPLNPLVIAMAVTMFIQQKLTPSAADPTQQKIMMMMPFIMLVMLYSLPSGLTLYWTISQLLTIIQLLINKYRDSNIKIAKTAA